MLPIKTILHPTDFSDCSRQAFRLASLLAQEQGARLIILHVKPPPEVTVASGDALVVLQPGGYDERLRQALRRLEVADPEVTVEHRLAEGNPARVIVEQAEASGCDLIVMGTHGRTGLGRLLLGSVAEHVLRKACCPVLTVKAPAPDFEVARRAAQAVGSGNTIL
jgi:nucleotide-binding universal stress UspA family protein